MITTKILDQSELTSILRDIQLSNNQYVFYFIKDKNILQLMCRKPNGTDVAVFNGSTVNQKYYKPSIQDVHPSGSDYIVINQSYLANGVKNVHYIIDGEPNLYCIVDGVQQIDSDLAVGSFTYYIDSKNNTYLFYIYDGRQWLPIYVQGGLGDHITDHHNPHKVTKEQIGLGNVENVKQITEAQYLSHIRANNPHHITKLDVGLDLIDNIEQLSLLDYVNHKNSNNPHNITKVHVGLDKILQNVVQIPYEEFLRNHIKAPNPHRITLKQLGLDKINIGALQDQTTQKEFQDHIKASNPHRVTKSDVGLDNVTNNKQADYQDVSDHVNSNSNPHNITKSDVGLGKVRNVQQANYQDVSDHINSNSNPHNITKADVGLSDVTNERQISRETFEEHVNAHNPHQVTKEQIGLGNVENVISINRTDYNKHIENYNNPHLVTVNNILGKDQIGVSLLDLVPQSEFLIHVNRTDNPHNITKSDIKGLSMIENINQLSLNDYNDHITAANPHQITKADIELSLVDNTAMENKPISSIFKSALKRKYLKSLVNETDPIRRQDIIEEHYGISYSPYIIDKKFTTEGTVLTDDGSATAFDFTDIRNQGKFVRIEKTAAATVPSIIGYEDKLDEWYCYIADGKIQRLLSVEESDILDNEQILSKLFPDERNILLRRTDYYKDKTVTPIVRGVFAIKHTLLEELIGLYIYNADLSNCTAITTLMDYNETGYHGVNFNGNYGTSLIYPLGNLYFIDKNQNEVLVPFQVIGKISTLGLKFVSSSLPSDSITVAYSSEGNKNYSQPISVKKTYSEEGISSITTIVNHWNSEDQYFKFNIPSNTTGNPMDIEIVLYQTDRPRSYLTIHQEG